MSIDYRSFTEGAKDEDTNFSPKWWKLSKTDMPQAIAKIIGYIKDNSGSLETQRQISNRLYSNSTVMGVNGLSYTKTLPVQTTNRDRITYNVIQSVVDTVVSKMAKNKPKPLFLTSGGDYRLQSKAKKLDKFVDGIFYENNLYPLALEILRDAAIGGTGCLHIYPAHGRIKMERVMISELYVDEYESFYGKPRQLHRVKSIDRQVLSDLYPTQKKAIDEVNGAREDTSGTYASIGDLVTVAESWHLPSSPGAKDGLHVISINNKILFQESYEQDTFPFVFLHWSKRPNGFWGQGLAEQLQNIQLEINKLLWVIQRSMQLAGSFKVLLENSSKIVKEHLNSDVGAIVTYTGTPPQYVTPPIVPAEIYQHLMNLKQSAYEQAGISQLSASSQKPMGLDSGKALREFNNIESDRFMVIGRQYEEFFMSAAKLAISVAKGLYEIDSDFEVKVPGKKFIETIKWEEVDLADDEYLMKIFPVSSLPNDPEGRLQTIQEYVQAGFIDPRTARKLLDFPDLEQVESLANAVEERINEILDAIVEGGDYTPPDPFMDLSLARQLTLQYYNKYITEDLEEEKLELFRTFLAQIDALTQQAQAPQSGMPGAQPQANPEAPPTSDLIPNVPQGV